MKSLSYYIVTKVVSLWHTWFENDLFRNCLSNRYQYMPSNNYCNSVAKLITAGDSPGLYSGATTILNYINELPIVSILLDMLM